MSKGRPRGSLLASFIKTEDDAEVLAEVQRIADNLDLTNKLIFLLQDVDDPERKILTYNAEVGKGSPPLSRYFTMRVHRKKQTNTLYTINALNLAVAAAHGGQTGKHLPLDWETYRESLLLVVGGNLVVHKIKVIKIFEISTDDPEPPPADPS
jgi:hypothetical protein